MGTRFGSAAWPAFFRRGVLGTIGAGVTLLLVGCGGTEGHGGEISPIAVSAPSPVDAGRYVVKIGGCNDCHTDGYMEADGEIPESEWLTGSVVGFRGPWGTTYPPNLRLTAQNMTEDQWVDMLSTRKGLPPMPWPSVNRMVEADQRAVYRFLRSLGPAGEVRTAALPPGVEPLGPWMDFDVRNVGMMASAGN